MGRTKIKIDYSKCGENGKVDPRNCHKCLEVCDPCVLLMHETLDAEEEDIYDPQHWRITPIWLSMCTRCFYCVEACPEKAIKISW